MSTRKITLKGEKQKAWKIFSLYIRNKYAVEGILSCFTCGKDMIVTEAQSGHGIPGRTNSVLFMEEVVKPQCSSCNIFKGGNLSVFTAKLIKELGIERYQELLEIAQQVKQYKLIDYIEIKEKYKKKLENI